MTTRTDLIGHFDADASATAVARIEALKRQRRDYLYPAARLGLTNGKLVLTGSAYWARSPFRSSSTAGTPESNRCSMMVRAAVVFPLPGRSSSSTPAF